MPARVGSITFDPARVEVSRKDRRWQLVAEGKVLKDFGAAEQDARLANAIVRKLGLDEVARVGTESQGMEYWLSRGNPPTRPQRGSLRAIELSPSSMRVERMSGQWCVRDEGKVYFAFGDNEADARQALEALRRYHFTQACLIGHPGAMMSVFFGEASPEVPVLRSSALESAHTPGKLVVGKFPRLAKGPDGAEKKIMPKSGGMAPSQPLIPATGKPHDPRPEQGWRAKRSVLTPGPDGRVVFDWRQVSLNQAPGACELTIGQNVLASFGPDVESARLTLSALRYYRCSEMLLLPGEVAGKWLVTPTAAPRGVMFGMTADAVRPDKLRVVQDGQSRYALAEGEKVVIPMGTSPQDAARLLEVMRKAHIDRISRLGPIGPDGVAILLRSK
jgi:hypothetical protein